MMHVLGNNIVVIQGKKQSQRGNIVLPDTAQEDSPTGEVLAVGPDVKAIRPGDTVLIPLFTYARVIQTKRFDLMIEDKPALVIDAKDVAVVWPRE